MKMKLFCSYSHKDEEFRSSMKKAIAQLEREKVITEWDDHKIIPGQKISENTKKEISNSKIVVFLLSTDFIASEACNDEWRYVEELSKTNTIHRIPIIIKSCPWIDFLGVDDKKALPSDGNPINEYVNQDKAWLEVYEGIKQVANEERKNFSIRKSFRIEIEKTEFISEDEVSLNDIFVFPTIKSYHPSKKDVFFEEDIIDCKEILKKQKAIIHGEDMSGKTTLCKHIFLTTIDRSEPALLIDMQEIGNKRITETVLERIYENQSEGDYNLWKAKDNKTIIIDNLSNSKHSMDFIEYAEQNFNRVIICASSNKYQSYFRDDERLERFIEVKIHCLSHVKQEELIRKRIDSTKIKEHLIHGTIDRIENHINSVIISNRLLPRYPFYILSILQTYEGFMPKNLEMTSHGHCYYVLILANLIKSGIKKTDDQINTCFNFAEHLAISLYECNSANNSFDFDIFIGEYKKRYLIKGSIISRLMTNQYGIISKNGSFKHKYMYYFFLGKHFASNGRKYKKIITNITEKSYLHSNSLILLFIIHHTNDTRVIDDVLIHTMCSLDDLTPATLEPTETKCFNSLVERLSNKVLSTNNIDDERKEIRKTRDTEENVEPENESDVDNKTGINNIYRILKNNEVLSRILKTKNGSLERSKLIEIIETISDSGLRLVKIFLDQNEVNGFITHLQGQKLDLSSNEIVTAVQHWAFLWTMGNIEKIVFALNNNEINELVNTIVINKETPAYDLIGYFSRLDSIDHFGSIERNHLLKLLNKHDDPFIKKVLSIRTQHYMNTHSVSETIEQSICSLLDINYKARIKILN